MPRNIKIALGLLVVAVLIGLISLGGLRERVRRLHETGNSEEQARREVVEPPITTPSDTLSQASIFWAAPSAGGRVEPTLVDLPLAADPTMRAKQVLQALIASAPSAAKRTVPSDTTLLAFYILPDGTAVADFSVSLSVETPSGILSEEMAVDSITQTLAANVKSLRRLKILIHGQQVETLAGHVDLTGYFDLTPSEVTATSSTAQAP
jgi:Sporulation and spore germination